MMRWLVLLPLCALGGCARHYTADSIAEPYGLWMGIWHGFVCIYALLANLASWLTGLLGIDLMQSIEVMGRPNTGFWYYVGFFIGLTPYLGGSSSARRS